VISFTSTDNDSVKEEQLQPTVEERLTTRFSCKVTQVDLCSS